MTRLDPSVSASLALLVAERDKVPPTGQAKPQSAVLHHCQANGCPVGASMHGFMCTRHWAMLPLPLREDVARQHAQCTTREAQLTSRDFLFACAQAIETVAQRERRSPDNRYRKLLAARHR